MKTMKNRIFNTITACNDWFNTSVVILKGYLTVELFCEVLMMAYSMMDKLKTFKLFFLGNIEN